jgi:hypothetical protein
MTPEQKRLADRIIKLLALASGSSFAAEAETARRVADELMRTHNITLGPGKPSQDTIEYRDYVPFAKGMKWELLIADRLAGLCSCAFLYWGTLAKYRLIGTIWNLDVLYFMMSEVSRQRVRAWMKYKGEGGEDSFNKFCFGFARALADKIGMITSWMQINKARQPLLAWYEDNVLHGKLKAGDGVSIGRATSEAGLAAGKDASLHRGSLSQPYQRLTGPK